MIAGSIGSEVGEAVDVVQRTGSYGEEFGDELADTIIRVADLAGYLGIDLGRAVHQMYTTSDDKAMLRGNGYWSLASIDLPDIGWLYRVWSLPQPPTQEEMDANPWEVQYGID